jgi:hypothetical protein
MVMTDQQSSASHISDYDIAMKPAAAAIQQLPDRTDESALLLKVLLSINENLDQVKNEVFRLVPEDAKNLLDILTVAYEGSLYNAKLIVQSGPNGGPVAKEIFKLATLMLEIFERLEIASVEKDIDESSDDYQAFFEAMVLDATKDPSTSIGGRKALFSLFED